MDLFKDSTELFINKKWPFLITGIVLYALVYFFGMFMQTASLNHNVFSYAIMIVYFLFVIVGVASAIVYFGQYVQGKKTDSKTVIKQVKKNMTNFFFGTVALKFVTLAAFIPTLLIIQTFFYQPKFKLFALAIGSLIIPLGIAFFTCFYQQNILIKNQKIVQAFKRSIKIIKEHFGKIVLYTLGFAALILVFVILGHTVKFLVAYIGGAIIGKINPSQVLAFTYGKTVGMMFTFVINTVAIILAIIFKMKLFFLLDKETKK